jgi:oligopeptide/dipeptide ABC transporter ATP-binding protein
MYAGHIVELGPTEQIIHRPEHPYTKALIASMLDPNPTMRRNRIEGLPGAPPDLRNPPSGCPFHPRCRYAMEVCTREFPPNVGTDDHYAACWWVMQQREQGAGTEGIASELRPPTGAVTTTA